MSQEIYVLGQDRSRLFAGSFLDHFLPNREVCIDEFPVPELAECPARIFSTEEGLMEFLEANPKVGYGVYWNAVNRSGPIEMAMLFYTTDGQLVVGLAVELKRAMELLEQLLRFTGSSVGMFGWEQRPSDTAAEFKALAAQQKVDPEHRAWWNRLMGEAWWKEGT